MKKIIRTSAIFFGILTLIIILFLYLISLDDGSITIKNIETPIPIHFTKEYVYLINLDRFFTQKNIQEFKSIDGSLNYLLDSGPQRQREYEKSHESVKEFIDLSERNFLIVKKIKIKGTILSSDTFLDIISDKDNNHYLNYSVSSPDSSALTDEYMW
jgi:hypothetical protein